MVRVQLNLHESTLIWSNLILLSCALVPIRIISVLSEFNLSLSSFIQLLMLAMHLSIALTASAWSASESAWNDRYNCVSSA